MSSLYHLMVFIVGASTVYFIETTVLKRRLSKKSYYIFFALAFLTMIVSMNFLTESILYDRLKLQESYVFAKIQNDIADTGEMIKAGERVSIGARIFAVFGSPKALTDLFRYAFSSILTVGIIRALLEQNRTSK